MTVLAGLAVLVRGIVAALFFGTSDVQAWQLLGQTLLAGENFYATQLHNWPPLFIYWMAAAWLAHTASGLPFHFLVKLPSIGADAAIAVLIYRAGLRLGWGNRAALAGGLGYALQPVSILVTAYHGQFDALMLACAGVAWYGFAFWRRWRLIGSGLALGLGTWFKPVPLLLLPVFLPRLSTWGERGLFTALAVGPACLGTLPYFVLWPGDVTANFLGYSSWYGQWGYPLVWMLVEFVRNGSIPSAFPDPEQVSRALRLMFLAGRWLVVAALVGVWWYTWRRGLGVGTSILATFGAFYFATSGFGLHYLVWIVPFGLLARDSWLWPYTLTASLALVAAYSLGAADVYLPATNGWPPIESPLRDFVARLASIPAWLVCGAWAVSVLRSQTGTNANSSAAV